jgi:hypothetical protein
VLIPLFLVVFICRRPDPPPGPQVTEAAEANAALQTGNSQSPTPARSAINNVPANQGKTVRKRKTTPALQDPGQPYRGLPKSHPSRCTILLSRDRGVLFSAAIPYLNFQPLSMHLGLTIKMATSTLVFRGHPVYPTVRLTLSDKLPCS